MPLLAGLPGDDARVAITVHDHLVCRIIQKYLLSWLATLMNARWSSTVIRSSRAPRPGSGSFGGAARAGHTFDQGQV